MTSTDRSAQCVRADYADRGDAHDLTVEADDMFSPRWQEKDDSVEAHAQGKQQSP